IHEKKEERGDHLLKWRLCENLFQQQRNLFHAMACHEVHHKLCSINRRTSSSFPSWNKSTILLPTITPSQKLLKRRACAWFETPNPAKTGTLLICFSERKYSPTFSS